jgi:hypothetical protein
MCPAEPAKQSSTSILDIFKDVPGCLSRLLDKIPESLGAVMGWACLQIWKAFGVEEVKGWK